MSSDSEAEPEENTIATDLVVTTYKMAADIINCKVYVMFFISLTSEYANRDDVLSDN